MAEDDDILFTGAIPKIYETYLVPLLFIPYAEDIAKRLAVRAPARVLEVAAGTGVVTRAIAAALPGSSEIVATDLNPAMLEEAAALGSTGRVEFTQADAMQLGFPDQSFDAVVCQFGVMFFPDKVKALGEMRRVLKPGGVLIFNVWDRLEANEFAEAITAALAEFFPEDPPRFLARAPYGYFDHAAIAADLSAAGFTSAPAFETIPARSRAKSAVEPAVGYCQGSPLRAEIDARGPLEQATDAAAKEIERRFGSGPVDALIQAHVVTVTR